MNTSLSKKLKKIARLASIAEKKITIYTGNEREKYTEKDKVLGDLFNAVKELDPEAREILEMD